METTAWSACLTVQIPFSLVLLLVAQSSILVNPALFTLVCSCPTGWPLRPPREDLVICTTAGGNPFLSLHRRGTSHVATISREKALAQREEQAQRGRCRPSACACYPTSPHPPTRAHTTPASPLRLDLPYKHARARTHTRARRRAPR